MAAIRLDQMNLVVRDVPASRAFYSRLGLDFGDGLIRSGMRITCRRGTATPPPSTSTWTA